MEGSLFEQMSALELICGIVAYICSIFLAEIWFRWYNYKYLPKSIGYRIDWKIFHESKKKLNPTQIVFVSGLLISFGFIILFNIL